MAGSFCMFFVAFFFANWRRALETKDSFAHFVFACVSHVCLQIQSASLEGIKNLEKPTKT